MTENDRFEDHVWMLEDMSSSPSIVWDITLGASCIVTSLLGFFGNCFALGYFWRRTDLPSQLYKHLCCIDIVMCVCQVPMIQAFLSGREPGMFNNKVFCNFWAVFNDQICANLYPMGVLLLSTSRTIAIIYPFCRIKKWLFIAVFYVYMVYLGLHVGGVCLAGLTIVYTADCCYCYTFFDEHSAHLQGVKIAEFTMLTIETGLPPILIFISFIISTTKLVSNSTKISSTETQQNRAAITIAIFTGVFLLCYLPMFALCVLYTYLSAVHKEEFSLDSGPFSNHFMLWYSWPLARGFFNTLNATLDFVIYVTRMQDFRMWLMQKIRLRKKEVKATSFRERGRRPTRSSVLKRGIVQGENIADTEADSVDTAFLETQQMTRT